MTLVMGVADWQSLLLHFTSLSLLAVGGAITTVPDMHRNLVLQHQWLTESQFNASIALAQAAPGPNVLFVALLGWNVGLNAGGGVLDSVHAWALALLGMVLAMLGILLPSTTLTLVASRWAHQNRNRLCVRAFKQGMAPIIVALLVATGWILTMSLGTQLSHWPLWLLTIISALLVWRTQLHLLWLLAAGGSLGWLGWV